MPLVPGEAEGVAASNAREAAAVAQSVVSRLCERLRQLESHVGFDTRNPYERIADYYDDQGVDAQLLYRRWCRHFGRTVKNPTPCVVLIDGDVAYCAKTWQEIWDQIPLESR